MIDPQLIFQQPENYKDYLQNSPEGQYFDRKEVRNNEKSELKDARKSIKECISAFTNSRGGVLILGISDDGIILGLDHLSESELNSLVQVKNNLTNHQAISKEFELSEKKLLAIYAPEGLSGVCKTIESGPKAWIRDAATNQPLTSQQEETLLLQRNNKWEQLPVCEAHPNLINKHILNIFKKRYLEEQHATYTYDDEDFLLNIGAVRPEQGKNMYTNSGFLFFANNPSSFIPGAQIRFLKYDIESNHFRQVANPTFDKTFAGCLPEMLTKVRSFVNEGAYFKKYSYRNSYQSGIIEEPELPPNAVEESIVNALIHRDYNSPLPIQCILYKDAFVVRSPGKLLQPGFIPTSFDLSTHGLIHYPRNPKISQWSKTMVDESGQRFVKLLSEGHRSMLEAMNGLNLPAPNYNTNGFTKVTLYNNSQIREAKLRKLQYPIGHEFTNLFEINLQHNNISDSDNPNLSIQIQLIQLLRDKLRSVGWFIDREKKSRITVHQKGKNVRINDLVDKLFHIYPAYDMQVYEYQGIFYLSIDYTIQVKNIMTLDKLLSRNIELNGRHAQIRFGGNWTPGIIESYSELMAKVSLTEYEFIEDIPCKDIIPNLSKTELLTISLELKYNLNSKLKNLSLAANSNAPKERAKLILEAASFISTIFPLSYNGFIADLSSKPLELHTDQIDNHTPFSLHKGIPEPSVKFQQNYKSSDILSGITQYGAISSKPRKIEIVPFCISGFETQCHHLIETLQRGQMSFRGMERTFSSALTYTSIISKPDANDYILECKRLLREKPEWIGNEKMDRIFLMHIPEDRYPVTDIHSPYYELKEFLLEKGIPVQMINSSTLQNPKFKDLNLALNIYAKTGGTPWVLPNALPDADCFIGLSYAQYRENNRFYRTMGYANVFDQYGQWKFYKGNSLSFPFEEKHIHLAKLVKQAIAQQSSLSNTASIHIHYTNKFSQRDRDFITEAVQTIRPRATISFVWLNTYHNIRMFDNRLEGNGSLSRGSYVITSPHQMFLSTTGYTPLKKTLGTPVMLQVNVRKEPFVPNQPMPYRSIAQHIISLTKLNWASTQSINGQPVTIKYANNIARLSSVFYKRKGMFQLHPVLEKTPWFI